MWGDIQHVSTELGPLAGKEGSVTTFSPSWDGYDQGGKKPDVHPRAKAGAGFPGGRNQSQKQ